MRQLSYTDKAKNRLQDDIEERRKENYDDLPITLNSVYKLVDPA